MQLRARVGVSCVAGVAALAAASAPAGAARAPITGKLSKPGYTVIALTASGRATSVRPGIRAFTLRPRAATVTLHLRARDGTYAGPIVVRASATRAVMGVRPGARLGRISVRRGYARVLRRLPDAFVDAARVARARRGVPIGARRFGRVRSTPPRVSVPGDRDLDGIPNVLDIDDDGDLIIDNLDRSSRVRAAAVGPDEFDFSTNLTLGLDTTANANALAFTDAQLEAALPGFGRLQMRLPIGDSVELDCGRPQSRTDPNIGGLIYCTRGGTGKVFQAGPSPSAWPRFPECCDPDGDGFGAPTTTNISDDPNRLSFFLAHGATSAQIGTGDVLIERVVRGGVESQLPAAVQYIFATVPALISYSDVQGNAATVTYPVPGPDPFTGMCPMGPPPCSAPGTRPNPFPVKAGPNGDVVVTLKFWRPQRRPIPPETAPWIDLGRLNYTAGIGDVGLACRQNAFSEQDPNLVVPSSPINLMDNNDGGFTDLAADQPASPANTFTYTINLTKCLATHGRSFSPGAERIFYFAGVDSTGNDDAQQYLAFKRQ